MTHKKQLPEEIQKAVENYVDACVAAELQDREIGSHNNIWMDVAYEHLYEVINSKIS